MEQIITVKDLINELEKWDENLPILIDSSGGEYSPRRIEFINYDICDKKDKCSYPDCDKDNKELVLFDENYINLEKTYNECFEENYEGLFWCRLGLSNKIGGIINGD